MANKGTFELELAKCVLHEGQERNAALQALLSDQSTLQKSVNLKPYDDPDDRYEAMANDYGEELFQEYGNRITRIQGLLADCSARDRQWAEEVLKKDDRKRKEAEKSQQEKQTRAEQQQQRARVEFLKDYIDTDISFIPEDDGEPQQVTGRLVWTGFVSMDQRKGNHAKHEPLDSTTSPIFAALAIPVSTSHSFALPADAVPRFLGTTIREPIPDGHCVAFARAGELRQGLEEGKRVPLLDWGRRGFFFLVDKFAVDKAFAGAGTGLLSAGCSPPGLAVIAVNGSCITVRLRPEEVDATKSGDWEGSEGGEREGGLHAMRVARVKTVLLAALQGCSAGAGRAEVGEDRVRLYAWEDGKSGRELDAGGRVEEGATARVSLLGF